MKQLSLSRQARRQLDDIAAYTVDVWGFEQMARYMAKLDDTIDLLRKEPYLGAPRQDLKRGYRSFPSGEHVILYRIQGDTLRVAAVMHRSMDLRRHL
jgi:toxin ParE1/3/4